MPEYLAPGVYVEETSFRSKSIEGVGTSTTAFVGPTRKGPLATTQRDAAGNPPAPPELLTSFGDFLRIYGGLDDLIMGGESVPNYIANGVLNFFNEGGSRLYVARVATAALAARRVLLTSNQGDLVTLLARFPGAIGNGRVIVREILTPANGRAMGTAATGTLLRARPATLRSANMGPFTVPRGSRLRIAIDGTPANDLVFDGRQVSVRTDAALGANVVLAEAARTVTVDIVDEQVVTIPPGAYTPAQFAAQLNGLLRLATARLATPNEVFDAPAGPSQGDECVITTRVFDHPVDVELATNIAGINVQAGFNGGASQVSVRTGAALANLNIGGGRTFTVRVRDRQVIQLPMANPNPTRAQFIELLRMQLQRATVKPAVAGDVVSPPVPAAGAVAPAAGNELVITTQQAGHATRLTLSSDIAGVQFLNGPRAEDRGAGNQFSNLDAVHISEIDAQLPGGLTATADPTGRMLIRTGAAGNPVPIRNLTVLDATAQGVVSVHDVLGYEAGAAATGIGGTDHQLFRFANGQWLAGDGATRLNVPAQPNPGIAIGSFLSVAVVTEDSTGDDAVFDGMTLEPGSPRYLGTLLGENPPSRREALENLFGFRIAEGVTAFGLLNALFPQNPGAGDSVMGDVADGRTATFALAGAGGADGNEPALGDPETAGTYQAAFAQLRGLDDISIVAAPGHSAYAGFHGIQQALLAHVGLPRAYRIAVLDSRPAQLPSEVREDRGQIDSTRAALYYPWIVAANPLARPGREDIPREVTLPPSAFVCGIYARNDVEQDVSKAPANEVVRGAIRFESDINFAQNQLLNPLGVNCLRFFPGRGYRVWGARIASSDPEWKYVNVRRYFLYLEASIDRGTQWAVFENNGPRLWQNIRETIEDFLYNEWVSNRLLGDSPKQAYFVRCDRSTMTQNDLDNGRLICLIGVAALKPAEFVIFRIGQKTADART